MITTIIPIHKFNKEISEMLDTAIGSVYNQDSHTNLRYVLLVYPSKIDKKVTDKINEYNKKYSDRLKINGVVNTESSSFQSQINFAVKNINTEYFSILEFDDELGVTYFKHAKIHIDNMKDVDVFLYGLVEVNDEDKALQIGNISVWSREFVGDKGEMGYLNSDVLSKFSDFKITGAVMKTKEFISNGGFKSNIELSFQLEFLLRVLNNASKVYTIPRIGVKHVITRKDSLSDHYINNMNMNERKFWFDVANREYSFTNDRIIDKTSLENKDVSN